MESEAHKYYTDQMFSKNRAQLVVVDQSSFSQRLREAMKERQINARQLAEKINRSTTQVTRYMGETSDGFQNPPIDIVIALCTVLQLTPEFLIGLKYVDSREVDDHIIHNYQIKRGRMFWECKCGHINVCYTINDPNDIPPDVDLTCDSRMCSRHFRHISQGRIIGMR